MTVQIDADFSFGYERGGNFDIVRQNDRLVYGVLPGKMIGKSIVVGREYIIGGGARDIGGRLGAQRKTAVLGYFVVLCGGFARVDETKGQRMAVIGHHLTAERIEGGAAVIRFADLIEHTDKFVASAAQSVNLDRLRKFYVRVGAVRFEFERNAVIGDDAVRPRDFHLHVYFLRTVFVKPQFRFAYLIEIIFSV